MPKFLVIHTAFTGDVVLATALAEKLHTAFPGAVIDFLVRKGNEGLLQNHPFIRHVLVWDKRQHKTRNLLAMAFRVRKERYTHVINPHRFGSSGFVTIMSGAPYRAGFVNNPFSFAYTRKQPHIISDSVGETPVHEVQPNPNAGKFKFKEETHDFGEVPEGPTAETDFEFKNVGKEPIVIQEAHGSCGCTVPKWPQEPILPGKKGVIHVTYNTAGRPGPISKEVTINSNAQQTPMVLHIRGSVKPKPVEPAANPAPTPAPHN